MRLITNSGKKNHRALIQKLILSSEKIIICSGWMKVHGLLKLLPSLKETIKKNNASITFFTNENHTESEAIELLREILQINHILIPKNKKTLHSKIYYFQNRNQFTAIIGSANVTVGGLIESEELSIEIKGTLQSKEHLEIKEYLNTLEVRYG